MEQINATASITEMLGNASEEFKQKVGYNPDLYAHQLGYCEGTPRDFRDFIHRVMMEIGVERAVELLERSGIKLVYVNVEV